MERTSYHPGEPCWADVTAPDPAAAREFYQAVFGWEFLVSGPEFGGYTVCTIGGRPVAGLTPPPPGQAMPPAWSLYLAAPDLDETVAVVGKAGGQVVAGPMEIPGSGRMAAVTDPTGGYVALWQAGGHLGFGTVNEPGSYCWTEFNSWQPADADAFYRELFPYQQRQLGDGESFDYTVWSLDGRDIGGRLAMTAEWGDTPAHWTVYLAVDGTDAACERIVRAGGSVPRQPFDSPYGRIAGVADPAGASFNIITLTMPAQ